MPICSNCGSYYVRPPCPACADIPDKESQMSGVIPTSAQPRQPQVKKPSLVQTSLIEEKTIAEEEISEPDPKDQQIENLKRQLAETEFEVDFLRKAIKSIKQEVDKQIANLKD